MKGNQAMLTNDVIERLARLVRLAPHLPKEMQEELHEIIKEMMVAERTEGTMPNSAIADLAEAVPDKLMAQIAWEDRSAGKTVPGGFLPPRKVPLDEALKPYEPKSAEPSYMKPDRGWTKPMSGERSAAQTEIFDQMVNALAGGPNDTSKLR
jgi:hypothetical protein